MTEIHRDDRLFVDEKTNTLPDIFKKKIIVEYHKRLKNQSRREANLYLLNISEHIESAVLSRLSLKTVNPSKNLIREFSALWLLEVFSRLVLKKGQVHLICFQSFDTQLEKVGGFLIFVQDKIVILKSSPEH